MLNNEQLNLQKHPDFRFQVVPIGNEAQPLVIVDNFISEPDALINHACELQYNSDRTYYPGVRTQAPASYFKVMYDVLARIIFNVFKLPDNCVNTVAADFSIVTKPPQQLHVRQRIPHFDSNRPYEIAMIHFLCSESFGGTSFYRHKSTSYEYVDEQRRQPFMDVLERECQMAEPPAQYINGDSELFERILSCDVKFNRLLIYRSTSLHSGNISSEYSFDPNPKSGRLTVTSFLLHN